MTNPRLAALQRQRDLLREHVLWLDGEIARESSAGAATTAPVAVTPLVATAAPPAATGPVPVLLPEPDIKGLHNEVRQGCLLYFLLAAGCIGALIAFIYWHY